MSKQDGIRPIPVGQAKIRVKVVFAVVSPEQSRHLCRSAYLQGRVWSLDEEDEIGRRFYQRQVDTFGLNSQIHTGSSQGGFEITPGVDLALAIAEHNSPATMSQGLRLVGSAFVRIGVELPETDGGAGGIRLMRGDANKINSAGIIHSWCPGHESTCGLRGSDRRLEGSPICGNENVSPRSNGGLGHQLSETLNPVYCRTTSAGESRQGIAIARTQ
jgi:hypothetical protein